MSTRARPRRRRLVLAAALLVALVTLAWLAPATPAASSPIAVTFVKSWVGPGHYQGNTGDGGTIEMWVSNSSVTGSMQHFDVLLQASLSDGRSFTAELTGTFNFSTARTLLSGVITEGWLAGARIREQGALVSMDPLVFEGTLWLMPASA